jgi:membrane-associated protease RseP (regulator of RpoE activity)
MAIKSRKVGFFDRFRRYGTFLRLYGSFGVIMVVIVSALITVMLIISLQFTLVLQPEPTGIYKPQNILLLPGVNEYVPSTIAVWLAFVLTIAIHEFGHAVLCRVEEIRVKSTGILLAVIPIGFFVEPDEEELEQKRGMPKMRMFGAGITNNIVVGLICFGLMVLVIGMAVPTHTPVIQGVYKDYPAALAGVPPGSIVEKINGIGVTTREDVAAFMNTTKPGDTVMLQVGKAGQSSVYSLTLAEWPMEYSSYSSGFMGVYYYDGSILTTAARNFLAPAGFFHLMVVPFDTSFTGQYIRILAFDMPEMAYFTVPFDQSYWGIVHLLFWCGWININVGIFNAIPMIPLDGGYILKEGVERLLEKKGWQRYAPHVTASVSYVLFMMLISLILLPYLLHM